MRTRSLLLLIPLLSLAGCAADDGTGAPAATVTDSLGVTIVENRALAELPRVEWVIGAEPAVEIGTVDGQEEYQLFRVRDATRLPDGRLAVLNGGSYEIRVYDGDGNHQASWGGEGGGPGEFLAPWTMLRWPGDSVAVWDGRARRITVFARDGTLGRSFTVPDVEGMDFSDVADITEDGNLLLQSVMFSEVPPETGYVRAPMQLSAVGPDGEIAADLGRHPGDESYMRVGEGTIEILRLPFTRQTLVASAGDEVLISGNERFVLRFFGADGSLARIVRVSEPPRLVTAADLQAELDRQLEGAPDPMQPGIRAMFERSATIDTFPAFSQVSVDNSGFKWVEVYRAPTDQGPHRWLILDSEGIAVGTLDLPEGLQLFEIGEDYLLGRTTDELGVERVQLWPLARTGA